MNVLNALRTISNFLRALAIFLPGILLVIIGWFLFVQLPQGQDVVLQSLEHGWKTGLLFMLAFSFWVITTWYTSRMIAYAFQQHYSRSPWIMTHAPRILSFAIFLVVWYALYSLYRINSKEYLLDPELQKSLSIIGWITFGIAVLIYGLASHFLNQDQIYRLLERNAVSGRRCQFFCGVAFVVLAVFIGVAWSDENLAWLSWLFLILQLLFLLLLILRRPVDAAKFEKMQLNNQSFPPSKKTFFDPLLHQVISDILAKYKKDKMAQERIIHAERGYFIMYHSFLVVVIALFTICLFSISFSRFVTSLFIVTSALALLLGFGNGITKVSKYIGINLYFWGIVLLVLLGKVLPDPHAIRTLNKQNNYVSRPTLDQYTNLFVSRNASLIDSLPEGSTFPCFIALADGGASRSGLWSALVLQRLHEDFRPTSNSRFADHLFALSGASGGSIGNMAFVAQLLAENQLLITGKNQSEPLGVNLMSNDLLSFSLARLLSTDLVVSLAGLIGIRDRAAALEESLENPSNADSLLAEIMKEDIFQLVPTAQMPLPALCINTTRVQDGFPGVVSTLNLTGSTGLTDRKDVLALICGTASVSVSTAALLGARFPYFSPGGRINNQYFVDGGYFDNSGAGITHEMLQYVRRLKNTTTDSVFKNRLKKLSFHILHISNSPILEERLMPIHPLLNNLAVPIVTIIGSYGSQTNVNDNRLRSLLQNYNDSSSIFNPYYTINLYDKQHESFPMNWLISDTKQQMMSSKAESDTTIRSLMNHSKK